MLPKLIMIVLLFQCCGQITALGQVAHKSKFTVDDSMKDTFAFTRQWAYSWTILKDDNGLYSATGEKITPADTVHLFFTAQCESGVQGGYRVRYCYSSKKGNAIKLNFSDGAPAYASEYYVYIRGDSFYFKPSLNYPFSTKGEKMVYPIEKQQLTLNKKRYNLGDTIIGYIDCQFVEVWTVPGGKTRRTKLYFKGYFCTPFKQEEEERK
jgi:hypothetical protein